MPMQSFKPFEIPSYVHYCRVGSEILVLNLHTDEYASLDGSAAEVFSRLATGSAEEHHRRTRWEDDQSGDHAQSVVSQLHSAGIITQSTGAVRPEPKAPIERPERVLEDALTPFQALPSVIQICAFVSGVAEARFLLRYRALEKISSRIRTTRQNNRMDGAPQDLTRLVELVRAFNFMLPFGIRARDACLLHSLSLLCYLKRFDFYPNWIFGVQTSPFNAHCWVQTGDYLLNDSLDHAALFTPIMRV